MKSVFAEIQMPLNKPFRVTSPFSWRIDPFTRVNSHHTAVDMVNENADPRVYPLLDGVVTSANWHKETGYDIWMKHIHEGKIYISRYAHIQHTYVRAGMTVTKNQSIGLYGHVGRSTGAHVHVEFKTALHQPLDWFTGYKDEQKKNYSLIVALLL